MSEYVDFNKIRQDKLNLINNSFEKGIIPGGLADGKTKKDVAKKHKEEPKEIDQALKDGIKVEMEHTNDRKVAKEIAMDHLMEDHDYYEKLKKVEKSVIDQLNKTDINQFLQKGKSFPIGTVNTYGGRKYIKTAQGWKFHGKGTGAKAKKHVAGAKTTKKPKKSGIITGEKDKFVSIKSDMPYMASLAGFTGKKLKVISQAATNFASGRQLSYTVVDENGAKATIPARFTQEVADTDKKVDKTVNEHPRVINTNGVLTLDGLDPDTQEKDFKQGDVIEHNGKKYVVGWGSDPDNSDNLHKLHEVGTEKTKRALTKEMVADHNSAYPDEKKMQMTSTTMKDGFYYGEHKMRDKFESQIKENNDAYFKNSGFKMELDGDTKTSWNKKEDFGYATQKYKIVEGEYEYKGKSDLGKKQINSMSRRFSRKPKTYSDVNGSSIKINTPDKKAFIASLDSYEANSLPSFNPEKTRSQYYLLQTRRKGTFLVDTSGYDYPRYVVKIEDHTDEIKKAYEILGL